MKYKVLKPHGGKIEDISGIRRDGEVYDIDDGEAAVLLRSGHIDFVKTVKPTKPAVRKTEVKDDVESSTD
jgi:hypothetical protein